MRPIHSQHLAAQKWDKRYLEAHEKTPSAASVLQENKHLLPKQGRALDYACGLGANALFLAQHGLSTTAWDISSVAIDKLSKQARLKDLNMNACVKDLENESLKENTFDVIVVSRYLKREQFTELISALNHGGVLFYQTYTQEKTNKSGPGNAKFLLSINELLNLCKKLRVLSFKDEGLIGNIDLGFRNESWIVAVKGNRHD